MGKLRDGGAPNATGAVFFGSDRNAGAVEAATDQCQPCRRR